MAKVTEIQWCDSTVNPVMGCDGCELFPRPTRILDDLALALGEIDSGWKKTRIESLLEETIHGVYDAISHPVAAHSRGITTTNIYHVRKKFANRFREQFEDPEQAKTVEETVLRTIEKNVTCYAAKLHLNKGFSIANPDRKHSIGYADTFEQVKQYEGRVWDAAKYSDLLGTSHPETPWKDGLARMIFVSDMGDAFSQGVDFRFLKEQVMKPISSAEGRRHLWLWLTKQPQAMVKFSKEIGGFPENVCVMTSLTEDDRVNLNRLSFLKRVKAHIRGLSMEPLRCGIDPRKLDLTGIHWVIVGGESGAKDNVNPFKIEWAEEIWRHCRENGVAYFLKQVGSNAFLKGKPIGLKDSHGGDWTEWPESSRIREFPKAFHEFRASERMKKGVVRPASGGQMLSEKLTPEERGRLRDCEKVIRQHMDAFLRVGEALVEIQEKKLYREKYASFKDYCDFELNMSRQHAYRLVAAHKTHEAIAPVFQERGVEIINQEGPLRLLKPFAGDHEVIGEIIDLSIEDTVTEGINGEEPPAKRISPVKLAAELRRRTEKTFPAKKGSTSDRHLERLQVCKSILPDILKFLEEGDNQDIGLAIHIVRELMEKLQDVPDRNGEV